MLGTAGIGSDVGQIDIGLLTRGKLDLGFFCGLFETLHSQGVALEINTLLFFEFRGQIIDQPQVKVFPTQEGIAIGGQDFELMLAIDFCDLNNRDVKGTAT